MVGKLLSSLLLVYIEIWSPNSYLWFQLEDTILLFGTLLLFDPVLFPIYLQGMTINWINTEFWSTSRGTFHKNNLAPIACRKQGVPDRAVIDTTWIHEISYMHVTCMS